MALIYCPECGHEISQAAVACPNCGRPIRPVEPVVHRPPVVVERESDGFPKWAIVPIVLAGAAALLVLFLIFGRTAEDDSSNLNVNISARRGPQRAETASTPVSTAPAPNDVASSQNVTIPGSQGVAPPALPSTGTVLIDARIATRSGQPQAVKNERFYLLDQDLETILSDAGLEAIEGETLSNSYGLAVIYPNRYADFRNKALKAIKPHIKYAGQTDAAGRAQLGGVEPNSYYLFAVTKTPRGYALWSSPVTVISGDNNLNLSPAPVTEVMQSSG